MPAAARLRAATPNRRTSQRFSRRGATASASASSIVRRAEAGTLGSTARISRRSDSRSESGSTVVRTPQYPTHCLHPNDEKDSCRPASRGDPGRDCALGDQIDEVGQIHRLRLRPDGGGAPLAPDAGSRDRQRHDRARGNRPLGRPAGQDANAEPPLAISIMASVSMMNANVTTPNSQREALCSATLSLRVGRWKLGVDAERRRKPASVFCWTV